MSLVSSSSGAAKHQDTLAKRRERLKQVRAQEKEIAAATRQRFRKATEKRQAVMLEEAESHWQDQYATEHAKLSAVVQAQSGRLGQAHAAATCAQLEQRAAAMDGIEQWGRARKYEMLRGKHAAQQLGEAAAARQYADLGAALRREHVWEVEAERSAWQVARNQVEGERLALTLWVEHRS